MPSCALTPAACPLAWSQYYRENVVQKALQRTYDALVDAYGSGLHACHEAAAARERARTEARQVLRVERRCGHALGHCPKQLRPPQSCQDWRLSTRR